MKNEMKMIDCKSCKTHMADLLLDGQYEAAHPEVAGHVKACATCAKELKELQSTLALLDHWTAPEPSTYFDSKLYARLREAQAAEPEPFWERVRSFVLFSTGRSLRPVMAGALALVMVAGGSGVLLNLNMQQAGVGPVAASPAVNDLKILDNNATELQQMDQLLDSNSDDNAAPPTT